LRFRRNVAENTFEVLRRCIAVRTLSNTVMDLNRRMFWNVLAMPIFVM